MRAPAIALMTVAALGAGVVAAHAGQVVQCTSLDGTPCPHLSVDCASCVVQPSPTGTNLTGMQAPGADLRGKDLRGRNLTGANLRNANLKGANLSGANLTRVNLKGAKLDGANLAKARILGATITGVSAVGTNWKGARFGHITRPTSGKRSNQVAYIQTTVSGNHCNGNFSGATITNSKFAGDYSPATCGKAATFTQTTSLSSSFTQANFTGVDVSYAKATGNNYGGQQLMGTNWQYTTGSGNNFQGAIFGTDTYGVANNFTGTDLEHSTCPNGQPGSFTNGPCQ